MTDWKTVAEDCTRGSWDGRLVFPQVLEALQAAGVERYEVDFAQGIAVYYRPDGAFHVVEAHRPDQPVTAAFSASGVEAAVRSVQAGKLNYREFCDAIAGAGCAGYIVSLLGRRAVYLGRTAESHVELFPPAP